MLKIRVVGLFFFITYISPPLKKKIQVYFFFKKIVFFFLPKLYFFYTMDIYISSSPFPCQVGKRGKTVFNFWKGGGGVKHTWHENNDHGTNGDAREV